MCGGQTYFFSKILSLNPQVYTRLIAAMRLVSDYNEVVAAMRSPRFLFIIFVNSTLNALSITLFPLSLQKRY